MTDPFSTPMGVPTRRGPNSTSNMNTPAQPDYISPSTRRHGTFASPTSFIHNPPVAPGTGRSMLTSVNDDEAERRERRRSKIIDLQKTSVSAPSPGDPSDRRKSLPLSGLSNAQVTEHYTNCIKLSAENKINSKNAFGLHLIDYMSELLKKKEMTNFQVASSTLDASAKIYAGRVDAIHSQTYKLLTGLGRPADGDKADDQAEGAGDEEDGAPGPDGDKKRKRARKSKTIETNLKNINVSKFDMEFEVDPLFKKTSAAFDEGGVGGLMLNHLRCLDDGSELVLDSNTVVYGAEEVTRDPQHGQTMVDLKEIRSLLRGVNVNALKICPSFADFKFLGWNRDEEDGFASMLSNLAKGDHAFDLDAEPEHCSQESGMLDPEPMGADDFDPMEDDGPDNETVGGSAMAATDLMFGDGKEARLAQTAMEDIKYNSSVGQLMQVLSTEPSEYSYFSSTIMRTWAGPDHWKLTKSRGVVSTTTVNGTQKSKPKKEPFKLEYDVEINFENNFKETKKATTLTKGTLDKYSKSLTTLPEDLHYDADKLFRVFNKPKILIKRQAVLEDENGNIDDNIDNYNYDNNNDRENFCPSLGGGDEDDDDNAGGFDFGGAEPLSQEATMASFANDTIESASQKLNDSLVAQPHKVNKIDIGYAKTAKKMDIKRLKTSIWGILNKPDKKKSFLADPEHPEENKQEEASGRSTPESLDEVAGDHSFVSLIEQLPSKVSKNMAKNLSVPIAFICLLHLANERNLSITSDETMSDLHITQG